MRFKNISTVGGDLETLWRASNTSGGVELEHYILNPSFSKSTVKHAPK